MIPAIILAIESPEDREYMTALYLEYERLMYWEIYKYVKNPWDADDILQTVLERLIDKLPELKQKEGKRRSAYVMAACRNTSLNVLKKRQRMTKFEFRDYDSTVIAVATPEDFVLRKEDYQDLYAVWETLDLRSKYLLEAKYVLEKNNKEIAADLGIGTDSVRVYLSRARNALRVKMNARSEE